MNAAQVAAEWARVFTLGKARGKIAELFEGDRSRAQRMSRRACGMLYDFSKTALTEESFAALIDLAEAADVTAARDAMFAGEKINTTEGRAVLHTALRAGPDAVIEVDGVDVMKLSTTDLRQMRQDKMSMVFQKFALLPHRTVLQNAAMTLDVKGLPTEDQEREAKTWLARVGLGGFENHYPAQLSGGMQQRVGIARALTSNSDIMLMDEAFSALDPLIRTDMQDLLLELQVELKKTIIFITHDLDEALKLADHLVILKDGAVVQQGEPQGILMNPTDPYIEDFVSDINRARVLRVRSVMQPLSEGEFAGDVQANDNLESLIATSGGDTALRYRVLDGDKKPIGTLDMRDLVKALVPRISSSEAGTRYH